MRSPLPFPCVPDRPYKILLVQVGTLSFSHPSFGVPVLFIVRVLQLKSRGRFPRQDSATLTSRRKEFRAGPVSRRELARAINAVDAEGDEVEQGSWSGRTLLGTPPAHLKSSLLLGGGV